jgi:hypothetical protein
LTEEMKQWQKDKIDYKKRVDYVRKKYIEEMAEKRRQKEKKDA